jgi:hypothetical protein
MLAGRKLPAWVMRDWAGNLCNYIMVFDMPAGKKQRHDSK